MPRPFAQHLQTELARYSPAAEPLQPPVADSRAGRMAQGELQRCPRPMPQPRQASPADWATLTRQRQQQCQPQPWRIDITVWLDAPDPVSAEQLRQALQRWVEGLSYPGATVLPSDLNQLLHRAGARKRRIRQPAVPLCCNVNRWPQCSDIQLTVRQY